MGKTKNEKVYTSIWEWLYYEHPVEFRKIMKIFNRALESLSKLLPESDEDYKYKYYK